MYGKEYIEDKAAREAAALAIVAVKEAFKDLDQAQLSKAWALLRGHDPLQRMALAQQFAQSRQNAALLNAHQPTGAAAGLAGIAATFPRGALYPG